MDTIAAPVKQDYKILADAGLPVAVAKFAVKRPIRKRLQGREIVLNKHDYKIIFEMACEGFSRAAIAQVLRVSEATFQKILARDDAALDSLDRGYSGDLQLITNILRSHAVDGSIHHIKAYLHVTHNIIVGEDQQRANGVQINVQMPFPVATATRLLDSE